MGGGTFLPDKGALGEYDVTGGDFGPGDRDGQDGGAGGVGAGDDDGSSSEVKIRSSPGRGPYSGHKKQVVGAGHTPLDNVQVEEDAVRTAKDSVNEQSVYSATTATSMATGVNNNGNAGVKYTTVDGKTLDLDVKIDALSEELELAQLLNS